MYAATSGEQRDKIFSSTFGVIFISAPLSSNISIIEVSSFLAAYNKGVSPNLF